MSSIDRDPLVARLMAYDDLVAYVMRLRKKRLYLAASQLAVANDQTGTEEGGKRGYRVIGHVVVNKPTALRFLMNCYSDKFIRANCKVQVSEASDCFFIGG